MNNLLVFLSSLTILIIIVIFLNDEMIINKDSIKNAFA